MIQAKLIKRFAPGFSLDIEFESAAGVTVFFGPGGSGKTLVLDVIAGFAQPDAGAIGIAARHRFVDVLHQRQEQRVFASDSQQAGARLGALSKHRQEIPK